ncbi:hypothetical protein HMPREF1980_01954 [Actinomyces sp. oral taxon 172 str. F0311]|nr:hypothetical protein HMPREF1980_01954 [Actinomyces sp. oral taxon 172 str. F0311]
MTRLWPGSGRSWPHHARPSSPPSKRVRLTTHPTAHAGYDEARTSGGFL